MISIPGYKIIEAIGQGGMASVYVAIQKSVARKVAIKVMSPSLAADPSFSERFLKEARMAHLTHPHIVTVYDAGEVDNQNYIVMEYAAGGSLAALIHKGIPISEIISIIKQIADALNYAHGKGVIHRDVKSENILLKEDGSAILVDFGIAKAVTSGTKLTTVGSAIGSPNYMSPEQARGLALDGRSDLYSLGIVLFECLTGRKPFDSYDTYVIGLKHISDPIPRLPDSLNPFQPIIDQLLAKKPEQRFSTGKELMQALDKISENLEKQHSDLLASINAKFIEDNTPTEIESIPTQLDEVDATDSRTKVITNDEKTRVNSDEVTHFNYDEVTQVSGATDPDATIIMAQDEKTQVSDTSYTDESTRVSTVYTEDRTRIASTKKPSHSPYLLLIPIALAVVLVGSMAWFFIQSDDTQIAKAPAIPVEPEVPTSPEPEIKVELPTEPEIVVAPKTQVVESSDEKREVISPPKEDSEKAKKQKLIESLLSQAKTHMDRKQYTTPKDSNASLFYRQVLELDPGNAAATMGLAEIVNRYYQLAVQRKVKDKFKKSLSYIEKGLKINPAHAELQALKSEVTELLKLEQVRIAKKQLKFYQSQFKADKTILQTEGNHKAKLKKDMFSLASQSLLNNIYSKLLKQCNSNASLLSNNECRSVVWRYLNNWPIPALNTTFKESITTDLYDATLAINQEETLAAFKALSEQTKAILQKDMDSRFTAEDIIQLSNYELVKPLMALAGLNLYEGTKNKLERILDTIKVPKISSVESLVSYVERHFGNKLLRASLLNKASLEVTPFDREILNWIEDSLRDALAGRAGYNFHGRYEVMQSGDLLLEMWAFDYTGNIKDYERVIIDKALTKKFRAKPLIKTDVLVSKTPIARFASHNLDIALSNQSAFAALTTGNKETLQVKMDKPGFFYLAVHVVRSNDEYSYLLPLKKAEPPFVETINRDRIGQLITLGEFTVTLPLGVEVLHLLSSNVNLNKYLPKHQWDDKKKQFIIEGSDGNVAAGIDTVRQSIKRIEKEALNPDAYWQEKLMVTSVLQ